MTLHQYWTAKAILRRLKPEVRAKYRPTTVKDADWDHRLAVATLAAARAEYASARNNHNYVWVDHPRREELTHAVTYAAREVSLRKKLLNIAIDVRKIAANHRKEAK